MNSLDSQWADLYKQSAALSAQSELLLKFATIFLLITITWTTLYIIASVIAFWWRKYHPKRWWDKE